MSDIDKLIRLHQQALIAAQAAKIMKLEGEATELRKYNSELVEREAERMKRKPIKTEVQA